MMWERFYTTTIRVPLLWVKNAHFLINFTKPRRELIPIPGALCPPILLQRLRFYAVIVSPLPPF